MDHFEKMKILTLHNSFKRRGCSADDVKFCPDGKHIVSTGQDETVKVSNVLTGKCKKIFPYKESRGMLVLSNNGKQAALKGRKNNIKILDLKTGRYVKNFIGHRGYIKSIGLSHNDKYIVSAALRDEEIRIWDIKGGTCKTIYFGPYGTICLVAFSSDDKRIIAVRSDCTVKTYDAKTRRRIKSRRLLEGFAVIASLSNDCKYLARCFFGAISLFIFKSESFEHVKSFDAYNEGSYKVGIMLLSFSSDNKRIATATDKGIIKIFDREKYACIKRIKPLLLAGGVYFFDLIRGKVKVRYMFQKEGERINERDSVNSLAFSPDSTCLAAGLTDGTVRVWGDFLENFHKILLFLKENNIFVDTQIEFAH
ncbi:WD40 repeat domain-containing protein [Candidatus Dependentiae bacterium]